jgi:hypothetical protein
MEKGGPRRTNSTDHTHAGAGKADARQAETKRTTKVKAPRVSESKERPQAVKKSAEEEEEDEDEEEKAAGGPAHRKACISLISAEDSVAWFVSHSFTIQSLQ